MKKEIVVSVSSEQMNVNEFRRTYIALGKDKAIYEKATDPDSKPGNSTNWVTYVANHHIAVVLEIVVIIVSTGCRAKPCGSGYHSGGIVQRSALVSEVNILKHRTTNRRARFAAVFNAIHPVEAIEFANSGAVLKRELEVSLDAVARGEAVARQEVPRADGIAIVVLGIAGSVARRGDDGVEKRFESEFELLGYRILDISVV